ncbi:hypothetical protein C9374_006641 [Naegleria lovaniensis]|uniref:ZZ-type domain-containing protein n=1 Tax=Naegleria lovaniensis TaxID=51637 RepID=A0AA88GHI2_NAELO|nr:uncharacterized protein C9374_006641 [Naegleria lovaniensis]KAG2379524.1 hypothetical protein C9374_006641 [Naegleria lovaniensis]
MMNNNNNNNLGYPHFSGFVPLQQQQPQQHQHFKVYVFENTSTSSQQLDIQKATNIHRLVIPYLTSFHEFLKFLEERKIIEIQTTQEQQQTVFYLDDENQWVTVANEDDWNILWSLLRGQKVIKVSVVKKNKKENNTPQPTASSQAEEQEQQRNFFFPWFGAQRRGSGCPRRRFHQRQQQQQQQQETPVEIEIPLSNLIDNVLGSFFPNTSAACTPQTEQGKTEEKKEGNCCNATNNKHASQSERESAQCPFASCNRSNGGHPFAHLFPFLSGGRGFGQCFNNGNVTFSPEQREQLRQQFGGLINLAKDNINNIPHFGVSCDGCNQRNFVGQRWKCQDCEDFDFCGKCFEEKAQQHAEGFHSFVLVEPRGKNFVQNLLSQFEQETVNTSGSNEQASQENASAEATQNEAQQPQQETVFVSEPSAPHSSVDEQPQELVLDEQLYPLVGTNNDIVTTTVTPSATVPPTTQNIVQEQPYAQQLSILRDMGFASEEVNLRLLNKYNGDIQRTVADLLSYY